MVDYRIPKILGGTIEEILHRQRISATNQEYGYSLRHEGQAE